MDLELIQAICLQKDMDRMDFHVGFRDFYDPSDVI